MGKALSVAERQARFRERNAVVMEAVFELRDALEGALDRAGSQAVSRFTKDLPEDNPTEWLKTLAAKLEGVTLIPFKNRPEGVPARRKAKVWKPSESTLRYVTHEAGNATWIVKMARTDGATKAFHVPAPNMLYAVQLAAARADKRFGEESPNWKVESVQQMRRK